MRKIITALVLGVECNMNNENELTEENIKEALRHDPRLIELVKNQTTELCLFAIEQNRRELKRLYSSKTENYLDLNFCCSPLKHIRQQSQEICLAAVKVNGYALKFVKDQTPRLCRAAVKQNPKAINYVRDLSMLDRKRKVSLYRKFLKIIKKLKWI